MKEEEVIAPTEAEEAIMTDPVASETISIESSGGKGSPMGTGIISAVTGIDL